MLTSPHTIPRRGPWLRPRLDGADPLLGEVVREAVVGAHHHVARQGDVPRAAQLLLEGQALRYKLLRDGRRQVTSLAVAGEVCNLDAVLRGRADVSIEALTPCVLGEIPLERVNDPDMAAPDVRRALWRQLLRDEAIAREWMVGLGRRSAKERVAHLLSEFRTRLDHLGLGEDGDYGFGLTQAELADVLGLSIVHVNRTLRELREGGLAEIRAGTLHIADHAALAAVAGFDPGYLGI